jgi:BlaI family transcriptional regulator, penicillinase repressor
MWICYLNLQQSATKNSMEELTKAEEKIMMIFWKLKKAFVKDVLAELPDEPKPPYNTISSVTRILASKGYLKYKAYGKTYEYYPAVTQAYYRKLKVKKMLSAQFGNSPASLLSFIIKEEKLSKDEINKLKEIINQID